MIARPGVFLRQAVGDRLEAELWVFCEVGFVGGAIEEAVVDVVGVEEGDSDAAEAEELSELEHGVDGALERKRENEYMWRSSSFLISHF